VVDAKSFAAQPITTVGEALQGRVSGVNVITAGVPGGSPKIRVRGANSINKSNDPLYVVDGLVRESGLEGINPEDIASMQILKDASSTAIYGSRGANGVVLITTRRGKAGVSEITFDASWGWSQATHLPKIMSTRQYAEALQTYGGPEGAKIVNGTLEAPDATLAPYLNGEDAGIDWVDQIFRTGNTQNYKLTYTSGNDKIQTYFSANYMRDKGVLEYSQYERYAARANVRAKVTNWLETTVDIDMSHGNGHGIGGFEMTTGPIWAAFNYSPTMHLWDETAQAYNRDPYNSIMNSPYGELTLQNERRRDILNGRLDLKFNICKGLTFTTSNGVDYANNYNYSFSGTNRAPGMQSSMGNGNTNRWLLQSTNNFTYINTWNDKHSLTATAVWEATSSTSRGMSISGQNLLTDMVGWWNVDLADTKGASNSFSKWTLMSAVARAIYSFDNRYMLTATFRADGSSRLSNNKWAYFPSVAAAWTISNEKFMQDVTPVMNNLKLRASWGIIGNQDIGPYQTLELLAAANVYYGTTSPNTGFWANKMPTPDLRWERTNQFDLGLDFGFLNNRIDLSLDYYYKHTHDALLNTTPPGYLGGQSYVVNAGEVSNTGLDISLNATCIQTRDWTWSTTIQGSYMKNKVVKLTAEEPVLYSGSTVSILNDALVVKEGESIGSFFGYRWAGVDADGYDTYYTADGEVTRTPDATDRVVLGKSAPDFNLGWNNTVTWKNLSLNVFFNGSFGGKRLNALRYAMNTITGNSRFVTDANWVDDVLNGKMADPTRYTNNYCPGESDKWLEKADYFRLENISLSYDLKRSVTKFADIRFQFAVQNAFTITNYKGVNPAAMTFASDGAEWKSGIDMGTAPCPRTYTLGVRFVF
ncbi:MAG: SusC/RagA family TonB-linked outer membrane protein, partial [Muribaculaceae bacterium]|nr:SusC/RagA family TonB-linked outer membrane protein [Muribaculaceae bacterium]